MNETQVYIQEEGIAAAGRVRQKILAAAAAGAGFSTVWAVAAQRKLIRTVPAVTSNVAISMAAFAVCQEGVRALRQGDHDAWNSFWGGAAAGAVLTRAAYGRGFHLLGMVMWGPLCGSIHWLNNQVQPAAAVASFLASQGLLDMPQQYQQQQREQQQRDEQAARAAAEQAAAAAAEPVLPRRFEDLSYREKKEAVEVIRQREVAELNAAMKQQQLQEAAKAAGHGSSSREQAPRKRWWLFG